MRRGTSPKAARVARGALLAATVLLHAVILAAPWVAPYDPAAQHRDVPFAPPTRLHFVDRVGRWHAQPFVCAIVHVPGTFFRYVEDCATTAPVRAFVRRQEPFGFTTREARHLFSADPPLRIGEGLVAQSLLFGVEPFDGSFRVCGLPLLATDVSIELNQPLVQLSHTIARPRLFLIERFARDDEAL